MSKTLRYRLLKVGAIPAEVKGLIAKENVLFSEEGLSVTVRRRGKAPGYSGGGTGKFSGAFAITDQRIVASISNSIVANAPYKADEARGAVASLANDGLHVKVDASIHPACSGEIEMHFKHEFSNAELECFPQRSLSFAFQTELVPKMFGVPG